MSHRFVKSVVITNDALFLDGEQFPFYMADDSLTFEPPTEQPEYFKILNMRLLVPTGEGWGDDLATIEDRRTPPTIPADTDPGGEGWTDIGITTNEGLDADATDEEGPK